MWILIDAGQNVHSFSYNACMLVPQPQTPPLSPRRSANSSSRSASRSFSGLMADVPACLSSDNLSDSLPEDFEAEYGASDKSRNDVRAARRVVVKVRSSCLDCHNQQHKPSQYCSPLTVCYMQIGTACVTRGKDSRLALGRLGGLVEQLETLVRSGKQVILVTSGIHSAGQSFTSDT